MSARPEMVEDFEVDQVDDGYVVYHAARDRVHYLNHTAALVLEHCTGENEAGEIVRIMQRTYDLPAPPEQEIAECIAQLRQEGLVR